MSQAKIEAPNRELTGARAGVHFIQGDAYTDDERTADFFARNGYKVTATEDASALMKEVVERSNKVSKADPLSHQHSEEAYIQRGVSPEDAALTVGLTDEQRGQVAGPGVGPLTELRSPLTAPAMIGPGILEGGPAEHTPGGVDNPDPMPTSGARAGLPASRSESKTKTTATGQKGLDEAQEGSRKAARKRTSKSSESKTTAKKTTAKKTGARRSRSTRRSKGSTKSGGSSS